MVSARTLALELLESRSLLHAGHLHLGGDDLPSPTHQHPSAITPVATEDAYENNDTRGVATNLGTLSSSKIVYNLMLNDSADWFKFNMNSAGTGNDYVKIQFVHTQGDLDMELYNGSGRLLSRSQSITNLERISLQNRPTGAYYLRVFGYRGAHNPNYSLTIDPGAPAVIKPSPTPVPTPAPAVGGFDIQLNLQGLNSSEQAIFQQAAARWEQIITGDLPNAIYNGRMVDDVLIDARATNIDGVGHTLGEAGPDRFRSGSLMPYHGSMQFDTADLDAMMQDGRLLSVVEHEMGHILGIGTLWSARGLLTGAGTSDPRFTGQRATVEYNAIFGLHENGVPVENSGGAGTRDAHWRDSVLKNELMTSWAGPGTVLPISRITIASLADLGYQVNLAKADPYSKPGSTTVVHTSSSTTASGIAAALDDVSSRNRQATDHVMSLWGAECQE